MVQIDWNKQVYGTVIYHIFTLIWNCALIGAVLDFVIGFVSATWYFAHIENGKRQLGNPVCSGVCTALRYHLGSLCLGSFLVACVSFLKYCVEWVSHHTKDKQSKIAKALICMCKVCLWCAECCLKFISR